MPRDGGEEESVHDEVDDEHAERVFGLTSRVIP
jgi:hypothetical protein